MDDDAPLSTLAKPVKLDDDTPLAFLADLSKPKASPKAKAGTSPAARAGAKASPAKTAAGKAAGKATPKKRAAAASSSSSSSSDSSSSESEEKPKAPRRKGSNTSLNKKKPRVMNPNTNGNGDEENEDGGGAVKKRDRSLKEQAVADLLCRWWYVLPDWPPTDEEFYKAELAKQNLRKVSVQEWEWVPETDSKGCKKVYELSQFRGLFRASNGDLIDLRPKETCPCYQNFMKKDLPELYELLVKAFENQLEDLKNSKFTEAQFEQELKARLTHVRDKAYKAGEVAGTKRRKSI